MTCSFIDFNKLRPPVIMALESNCAKVKIIPVQSNRYHKSPCKEIVGMENFSVTHKTVVSPLKSVEQHQQQKVEIKIYCLVFQSDNWFDPQGKCIKLARLQLNDS